MSLLKFYDLVESQDWPLDTQVNVLLEYIEKQQSPEAFEDFLESKRSGNTLFEVFAAESIGMKILNSAFVVELPIHYIDVEQPATCPKCGVRTHFQDYPDLKDEDGEFQLHVCLSRKCNYTFLAQFDPEQVAELEAMYDEEEEAEE